MPTRAYLRLDPGLRRAKRDYPDGAFRAFVEVLCAADGQEHRGKFENRGVLRAVLGPRARWITYLIDQKDLREARDGELQVVGWDDWQEGDLTVAERVARLRAKRAVTAEVTDPVTPGVTVPVTASRQTAPVRRRPSSGGVSVGISKSIKSISSSASPSHRARGRASKPAEPGPSFFDLTAEDPRFPVAKLLATRFKFHAVTPAQWQRLAEAVDNEYPAGTAKGADPKVGWRWLASRLRALDRSAGDPISAFFAAYDAELDERRAKAIAAESAWESTKQRQAPAHPGLLTGARQLAGRLGSSRNGKVTPERREQAIAMLRQSRGLIDEPMWTQLLGRYHLTEADLA